MVKLVCGIMEDQTGFRIFRFGEKKFEYMTLQLHNNCSYPQGTQKSLKGYRIPTSDFEEKC